MIDEDLDALHVHEWAAIASVIGVLVMLIACAYLNSPSLGSVSSSFHTSSLETIEVFVQGCVEHPGPIRLPKGASMDDLLKQVVPLPQADLHKINLKAVLKQNQVVNIKEKRV